MLHVLFTIFVLQRSTVRSESTVDYWGSRHVDPSSSKSTDDTVTLIIIRDLVSQDICCVVSQYASRLYIYTLLASCGLILPLSCLCECRFTQLDSCISLPLMHHLFSWSASDFFACGRSSVYALARTLLRASFCLRVVGPFFETPNLDFTSLK